MPGAVEARAVYRALLREGAKFPSYNIKEYILRQTRSEFRAAKSADAAAAEGLLQRAKQELEVVRRQSVVYGLYGHKHKTVMELKQQPAASG